MDYDSSEEILGKPIGSDLKEGHITHPLLHLYHESDQGLRLQLESFIQDEHLTRKELDLVIERMRETKSIEATLELAKQYIERGKSRLKAASFKSPEYIEALHALADNILQRHLETRRVLNPT